MELVYGTTSAKQTLKNVTNKTERHIDKFARVGLVGRAAVYFLTGVFALLMLSGRTGGTVTDNKGSLVHLFHHAWGIPALVVLSVALIAYAIFRMFQGVRDYDGRGSDAKGLILRVGYFFGGVIHLLLAYYSLNLIFHLSQYTGVSAGSGGEQGLAAKILAWPAGEIILGAIGIGVVAFGIGQFVIALNESFTRCMTLPSSSKPLLCGISKFGLIARGVMFAVVGYLFVMSAWHHNSAEARGMKGAWSFFATQPFGIWIQLVIALGLIAFAFYGVIEARYRHYTGR